MTDNPQRPNDPSQQFPGQWQQRSITSPTGGAPGYKLRKVQSLPPQGQMMDAVWDESQQAICVWTGERWACNSPGSGWPCDIKVTYEWRVEVAAGRGVEGQAFVDNAGFTYYMCSELQSAVDKAVTLYGPLKDSVSIGVTPGVYSGGSNITWPEVLYTNVRGGSTYPCIQIIGFGGETGEYAGGLNQGGVIIPRINVAPAQTSYRRPIISLFNLTVDSTGSGGAQASLFIDPTMSHLVYALNVKFLTSVRGSFQGALVKSTINFYLIAAAQNLGHLRIDSCNIGHIDFSAVTESDPYGSQIAITNCIFYGDDARIILGASDVVVIEGNTFSHDFSGYGTNPVIRYAPASNSTTGIISISNNSFSSGPSGSGGSVIELALGGYLSSVSIVGNTFGGSYSNTIANPDTAYIKLLGSASFPQDNIVVMGNTFGQPSTSSDLRYLTQHGGFTVIGTYVRRSVFGPNGPAQACLYKITNGANNEFYPGTSYVNTGSSGIGPQIADEPLLTWGPPTPGIMSNSRQLGEGLGIDLVQNGGLYEIHVDNTEFAAPIHAQDRHDFHIGRIFVPFGGDPIGSSQNP